MRCQLKYPAKDNLHFLLSINELNWVFKKSHDLIDFLNKIVKLVFIHVGADICSIFLYDDQKQEICLKAAKGIKQSLINVIHFKVG
jgi:phosphotransferase system enzyme I (PtsP)